MRFGGRGLRRPLYSELVTAEKFAVTANGTKIYAGFLDGPSCEIGIEEARALAEWFALHANIAESRARSRRRR